MSPYPRSALSPAARIGVTGGVGAALVVASVATAVPAAADDHVVSPGETVSHLALRYGTTTRAIVSANGLDSRATIRAGQSLAIPAGATTPAAAAARATAPVPDPVSATYTVASGDTVSAIAHRFGTTVAAVSAANGLDARALIRVGQVLTVPSPVGAAPDPAPAAPAPAPAAGTYVVAKGDTVSAVAHRFGTTVSAIVAANDLDGRASIRAGQTLHVPGATVGATSSVTSGLVGASFAGRTYPQGTVAAANQNKASLLAGAVPGRVETQRLVAETARAMGVDPALAQAIAFQESGFNHTAVSPANAIGTMQVIPTSGQWASDLVGRRLDLLDPKDNVVAGVAILKSLLRSTNDRSTAIAGYYQGLASVRKNGMFADTRRYVASVQTLMSRFA